MSMCFIEERIQKRLVKGRVGAKKGYCVSLGRIYCRQDWFYSLSHIENYSSWGQVPCFCTCISQWVPMGIREGALLMKGRSAERIPSLPQNSTMGTVVPAVSNRPNPAQDKRPQHTVKVVEYIVDGEFSQFFQSMRTLSFTQSLYVGRRVWGLKPGTCSC